MTPFRSHADVIAHLAIHISMGNKGYELTAEPRDKEAAMELIKRAGIRMYNEPAPDWHRARRAMVMTA